MAAGPRLTCGSEPRSRDDRRRRACSELAITDPDTTIAITRDQIRTIEIRAFNTAPIFGFTAFFLVGTIIIDVLREEPPPAHADGAAKH